MKALAQDHPHSSEPSSLRRRISRKDQASNSCRAGRYVRTDRREFLQQGSAIIEQLATVVGERAQMHLLIDQRSHRPMIRCQRPRLVHSEEDRERSLQTECPGRLSRSRILAVTVARAGAKFLVVMERPVAAQAQMDNP